MNTPRILTPLLTLLLTAPLGAQIVDADIHLMDQFSGSIDVVGDVDALRFEGLAGEAASFVVRPDRKSSLVPRVEIIDESDASVLVDATPAKKKVVIKNLVLPETGSYLIRVSSSGGSVGEYVVKTKGGKLPLAHRKPAAVPTGAPGTVEAVFGARAGSLLTAKVRPTKGSDVVPDLPVLNGPSGPVSLAGYLVPHKSGTRYVVKRIPLPVFGDYAFTVGGAEAPGDPPLAKLSVKKPKLKKRKLTESTGSGEPHYAVVLDPSIGVATTTDQASFELFGVVLDLDGGGLPAEVDWSCEVDGSITQGACSVDPTGAFTGTVDLAAGDNLISLGVGDVVGLADVVVTCNPDYLFAGQLVLAPDVVYVSETREITALIALTDPTTEPTAVSLVQVSPGNETLVTLLHDDGDLAHGDEIQGDGTFSGLFDVNAVEEGFLRYRVVVGTTLGGSARSEVSSLLASTHVSEAELQALLTLQEDMQDQIDAAVLAGTLDETLDAILAELQARPDVAQAGKSESGQGIWVVYESGIAGILDAAVPGEKRAPAAPPPAPPPPGQRLVPSLAFGPDGPPRPSVLYDGYRPPRASWSPQAGFAAAEAPPANRIKSNKALVIAAQYFDWGDNDDIPVMAQLLEQNGCFDVTYKKYTSKGAGSIFDFMALGSYGIICISSHGDSYYRGLLSSYKDKFGWNGWFGQVILHSNDKVSVLDKLLWEDDLKKGRLVLWYGDFGMTPSFFTHYAGRLPNSLVYMSICRGTWNATLANAFLARGAAAYLGYSDYVAVSFCKNTGVPFMTKLLGADKTIDDAFTPGLKETDKDPAEFKLFGSKTLSLDVEGLQDGGFESGAIDQAWTRAGDGRVIPVLGGFSPTEGSRMGIISTGLGFTVDSGSFSQVLCLADDASAIAFDWNFISEEFLEYCNSIYQDDFRVTLTEVDNPGNSAVLLHTFVDALCGSVFPVSFGFDQGDAHATGWNSANVSIPASLKGKKVELSFACSDVGDSIYDTAVLVDDVRVVSPAP